MENIKTNTPTQFKKIFSVYSDFIAEVRKRLIFTLSVFGLSMLIGFFFYGQIIKFLINTLSLNGINIVFSSPFQFINLAISCGVATGLIVAFPILIYQILSFLRPALKGREYNTIIWFIPFVLVLFITGFIFGFLIMKWQVVIFLDRASAIGIGNILDISRLLSVVLLTSVLLGLGFQFPIVLLILMRIGLLKPKALASKRKWIYLGSFVFAMLLPPDSILADVILSLPLIILYELTLVINRSFDKSKEGRVILEGG